jgi:Arf-GAP/coiled-coil/ANK repeat/PH domain-containing protein
MRKLFTNISESEKSMEAFTHTDPLYDSEQSSRYQRIKKTSQQLQKMNKVIENYVSVAKKYSSAILELHECIQNIDIVAINSVYINLNNSLLETNSLLTSHINQVEANMHVPTESFIKHDMNSMVLAKREYFSVYSKYTEANDKFISGQKKGSASIPQDKMQKILDLHRQSSHSFYDYVLQLDVTESRYNNLIGNILIAYIKSWEREDGKTFSAILNNKSEEITLVQEEILKTNELITSKMLQSKEKHALVDYHINNFYQKMDLPFEGTPLSSIQGYLWKKSGIFSVLWEKLFFMCRDGFLAASTTPGTCAKPILTLQLVFCDIKVLDNEERPNCFSIISKDKIYVMQAPSLHMRDKWVATIRAQKEERFQSPPQISHHAAKTIDNPDQMCADCGSPKVDWLIVNRGAILCEQCAGIHRGMPAAVSRIKSFTMDKNDIYVLELKKKLGNNALNSILEANLSEKISPTSTREERSAFINKKYIEKEFISTEPVDLVKALKERNLKNILHCILDGTITQKLPDDLTALHAAAIIGDPLPVALIALNNPSMLNALDKGGWTPLNYATYFNHYFCVDVLLLGGADPVAEASVKPYAIAASKGFDSIAMKLSEFRPETFEVITGDPPSSAFVPADGIDLFIYETSKNANRVSESGISKRNLSRRNTLVPRSLPLKF